jgi:hypothetical protein
MPLYRKILLAVAVLGVGGSLGFTAYYGLHLRSECYRAEVERDVAQFFELPCDLGRIRGRTFDSRAFEDVSIWLPDRRERVFHCRTAAWREVANNGTPYNELDLIDGQLMLGSDQWRREDYQQLFKSGLGHDFAELDLQRVGMTNFEIDFARKSVAIRCRGTSGTIDMTNPRDGVARLVAYELNGHRISQGVQIDARFSPKNGVEVSEFVLALPEVPLPVIGIGPALGGEITQGRFAGQIEYRRDIAADAEPEITLAGELRDVDLSELTRAVPLGPFAGRLSVRVEYARLVDSIITHFRGQGQISNFTLAPFAPLLGAEHLGGTATFNIDPIDMALGQVNRIRLDGIVRGVVLEEILRPFGRGSATGDVTVRVSNLDIVEDNIRAADVEISVLPPNGQPGTIDRGLLLAVAEDLFGFTWPDALPESLLPEQVEYAEFGVRLIVRDNQLRIFGTHGANGDTILTIKVMGNPIELIKEQRGTTDLTPYLERLREAVGGYDAERVRDLLRAKPSAGSE